MVGALSSKAKQSFGFALIIGIFLYLAFLFSNDWEQIKSIAWENIWYYLLPALTLCFIVQLLLCFIWHKMIQANHKINYQTSELLRSYFLPIIGKYLPGKVLFVLGRIEFLNKLGVSRREASSLFLLETFLLIIAAVILSTPYLEFLTELTGIKTYTLKKPIDLIPTIFFGVILLMASYFVLVRIIRCLAKSKPASAKLLDHINNFQQGIKKHPHYFIGFLCSYIGLWLCYALAGIIICISIDPDIFKNTVSGEEIYTTFFLIGSAFVASWLIGFLAVFSPGGLGVREVSLILFLSPIMSSLDASLAALIARLLWTISEFSFVAIAIAWPQKTNP